MSGRNWISPRSFVQMMLLSLLAVPPIASPILAQSPEQFRVHDFMPDFWEFWSKAHDQPVQEQVILWRTLYVSKHQDVFNDLSAPCKDEFDASWSKVHYFPNLPNLMPKVHQTADSFSLSLPAAQKKFLQIFRDMHWAGDVYLLASGYCFNGRAQIIQGREAILIGADTRVALGQQDLIPGLEHELFHRYHHQFFEFEPSAENPLWVGLWAEGMAEYVAEQLNPQASDVDLGLIPKGMVQTVKSRRQELSKDFLNKFGSTSDSDARVYFNNSNSKDPFVPPRSGYELGVLVVEKLSKIYTVDTMAHWSREEAKLKIRGALEAISQS